MIITKLFLQNYRRLMLPKQMRYQTALLPDIISNTIEYTLDQSKSLTIFPAFSTKFPKIPAIQAKNRRKNKISFLHTFCASDRPQFRKNHHRIYQIIEATNGKAFY